MAQTWTPDSWTKCEAKHLPRYEDGEALAATEGVLANFPPLVFAGEARELKAELAEVAAGHGFLLQGGDCAESFAEFHPNNIRDTFRVMLQMAVVLTFARKLPVVKLGRMAGQFAKPRSAATETIRTASTLPSYRGDNINGIEFNAGRPRATIRSGWSSAYRQSAATLNLLRAFAQRRLCQPAPGPRWTLDFMGRSPWAEKYQGRRRPDRRGARLHGSLRDQSRDRAAAQAHQLLHQPRGAAAALRAGADAAGFA